METCQLKIHVSLKSYLFRETIFIIHPQANR